MKRYFAYPDRLVEGFLLVAFFGIPGALLYASAHHPQLLRSFFLAVVAFFFALSIGSSVHAVFFYVLDHIRPGQRPRNPFWSFLILVLFGIGSIAFYILLLTLYFPWIKP